MLVKEGTVIRTQILSVYTLFRILVIELERQQHIYAVFILIL